jgi:hypothetical protein
MRTLLFIFFITLSVNVTAQNDWLTLPTNQHAVNTDSLNVLDFSVQPKGSLVIFKDPKLDDITKFVGREKKTITGTKIDGYRIQIFFDESKTVAQSQKVSFINAHPEHKAYIDYMAPNYRVRVGNFRTKLEAEKLKQELIAFFPTCIVIKDEIELPKIKLESANQE